MNVRRAPAALRAAALALATVAIACVSLGCPPDNGARCRFDGDDTTACGKCIAASCQSQVNKCCDDQYSCLKTEMPKVDACSRGEGCSSLSTSSYSGGPIATCIQSWCATPCLGTVGGSGSNPNVACVPTKNGCQCSVQTQDAAGTAAVAPCSSAQVPSGNGAPLCCATSGFPDVAFSACRCYGTTATACLETETEVAKCR